MTTMRGLRGLLCVCFGVLGCKALNPAFELGEDGTSSGDETSATSRGSSTLGEVTSGGPTGDDETMGPKPTQGLETSSSSDGATSGPHPKPVECDQDAIPCNPLDPNACPDERVCRPIRVEGDPRFSTTACVPIHGEDGLGQVCEHFCPDFRGIDSCAPRSVCDPFVDGVTDPTCIQLCAAADACFEDSRVCVPHAVGPHTLGLCRMSCEPFVEDGTCPNYAECVYINQDALAACIPTAGFGLPGPGQPCDPNGRCAERSVCVSAGAVKGCEASGCCAPACEVATGNCDSDDLTCEPSLASGGPSDAIGACVPFG